MTLETVDGVIVFDLDDDVPAAGGTRLAPDVTEAEVALLARAMTFKFAALGARLGGAKIGLRADAADRAAVMARYCEEIRPLVEAGTLLTGPDLGTSEADFAPLRAPGFDDTAVASTVDGVPFEDVLTGFGVAVAADIALDGLDGRTVAIEGFGKVGGGVAHEVCERGGRVVAVSTLAGCIHDAAGFDVEGLWAARAEHGDRFVEHLGLEVRRPGALFDVAADVVVPGARTGVIDRARAESLRAAVVVPASNVPYTAAGLDVLRARGVDALPDFVCNAGAVLGYQSPRDATHAEVLATVAERISDLVRRASAHPDGPYAGACTIALDFLRSWRDRPDPEPPLA